MAEGVVGRNMTFPIFNSDGTPFNDLVLHKATYDTVVMSLGDKITGDVYYKDNTLAVTMGEYIEFKQNPNDASEQATKFILVNPPTVVKEGMVSDNSELRGMTKYSFTFYHPMCLLANFPFSDVAVTNDQKRYLSENKSFSWIGTMEDYVAKLNKNLEGTQWVVVINTSSVAQEDRTKLSDVMTFDNQSIADALKTGYETWKVPYVVDVVTSGEVGYSSGKRFKVMFGLPTTEIRRNSVPFVFKYGQGVGLKNNSRTPRNNKIVTRIAGYGSEDNIPYGYPQIIWTGNQSWDYTINNDSTASNSYPIYDGIVGGQKVRLIKHPFTRTHLMPSVYIESLNRKVNPNATGYDPTEELVDYYDADNTYENPINPSSPSYEIHEFGDIKPELGDRQLVSVATYDTNSDKALSMSDFIELVDKYYSESENDDEKTALVNLKESIQENESDSGSQNIPGQTAYNYWWDFYTDGAFIFVTFSSTRLNFTSTVLTGEIVTPSWDDTMDDDGNYVQSYFKVTLPALGFDLYACAAITQEMKINMRSGACMGCSFDVAVDWDAYKASFYDEQGNFDPAIGTGHRRDEDLFPDSTSQQITLIVKKDIETFGTLMPNIYQQPAANDKFVIIGISLPTSYITSAQTRLDDDMKQYMRDNNVYYYDYPLKFDEYFLAQNTNILTQMKPNIVVYFEYAGVQLSLYIKQMTVKYGDSPLPQYNITLTDDVEIVLNQIGQVASEVSNLRVLMGQNGFGGNASLEETDKRYLRKDADDTAAGLIRMIRGMQVGERFVTGLLGEGGIFRKDADGKTYLECDRMYVRMKAYFDTVEVRRFIHSGGNRIASAAGMKCSRVEYITSNGEVTDDASLASKFRCYFRAGDNGTEITNDFVVNDLAYCKETNIAGEQQASANTAATRSVSASRSASEENITISLTITNNTSAPVTLDGDVVFVLSNPDIDGNYHGWQGTYNRTSHLRFSNSAVTLAANESRTVSVSGELYRRSPANDSEIADAGRRSNVLLYVGGNSEIAICSNMSHSIVFQDGGSYSVSISQIRQGAVQRFYWRKVIGVSSAVNENGEHYIDLSKTDCATGSDIPIAQDDIIQLGNTTDNSRQGAIIEYVSGEDAPSYQIYQDINSYSLEAKNYVRLGYDSESGGAQAYIGNPDGSTYLWYHLVTEDNVTFPRLDIKANVEFSSPDPTYGTETLDDFIAAITQNVENIQDQVDGNIESWFYDYMPVAEDASGAPLNRVPLVTRTVSGHTVPVYPYYDWYTADGGGTASEVATERTKHLGDTFYDNSSGYAFRFTQNGMTDAFEWAMIEDSAVIKALADAARAQDTADHKRRVFLTTPTPPYDEGDLWVNAVWPTSGEVGSTYNNDLLKCKSGCSVPRDGHTTFDISDWGLATNYGTRLTDFITNTYAPFVQQIENQVDQKAETWYQNTDPSASWTTAELKAEHVGDMWYCTDNITDPTTGIVIFGKNTTWIYQSRTNGGVTTYYWAEAEVPEEVFDMIDGKADIFVSKPTTYNKYDLWIIEDGLSSSDMPPSCQSGDIVVADNMPSGTTKRENNYVKNDWRKKDRYTDDTRIIRFVDILTNGSYTGGTVDFDAAAAAEYAIKHALNEGVTTIDGGLILSNIIALRDTTAAVMSGLNGVYNGSLLGGGIAAWYGGAMVDIEALTGTAKTTYDNLTDQQKAASKNYAKSLDRFDGSGYRASGNITWDASGNVTLQGYSINATTLQKGGVAVATTGDLEGYVTIATAQTITGAKVFTNKVYLYKPNSDDTGAVYFMYEQGTSSVKLVGNFYATGAVSALGSNSGGGGSSITLYNPLLSINNINANPTSANSLLVWNGSSWGYKTTSEIGTNMSAVWSAMAAATNEDINITHIISALVGCLTQGTDISITRGTGANVNKITIASTYSYSLPTADATTKGGIKVGTTLAISNEILNLAAITLGVPTSGDTTYTKVVVDGYGRIIKATTLAAGDIPDISGTYALKTNTVNGVAVGTESGHTNDLAITKNGTTTYITVPFASTAASATNATNATYATQLQTTRYLWGQAFNGTANVTGIISSAHAIEFTDIESNAGHGGYIDFHYNGSSADYTSRIIEDASGVLGIVATAKTQTIVPISDNTYDIGGASHYYKYLFIKRIYLSRGIYLEVDGDSVKLNGNFYATGAVSALGSNSSGGGSSPISLNNLLNSMNQATVAEPSVGGVAAVYNGSNWVYSNTSGVGLSVGGNLTVSGSANINSVTTASITSAGGFVKSGSTNDYVLLAGGGTAALSSIGGNGTYITSLGDKSASDLPSTYPTSGLSLHGIYNNGYPFAYGSGITAYGNGGAFQIAGQWNSNVTSTSDYDYPTEMYIRGRRDSYDVWTTWSRVLTDRNFSSYALPLTGGTLTSANSSNCVLAFNSTNQNETGIQFQRNGVIKGCVGYLDNHGLYLFNNARGGYLFYSDNGALTFENNTVWHSGNDGSGSGLDADMCDGYHLAYTSLLPCLWNDSESAMYYYWYKIPFPTDSTFQVYDIIVLDDSNYRKHGHFRLTISRYSIYSVSFQLICLGLTYNVDAGHLYVTNDSSYIYIQGIANWNSALLVRCIYGQDSLVTSNPILTRGGNLPNASCKPVIMNAGTRRYSLEDGSYSDIDTTIAATVGNADTVDYLHASDFVRAYVTTNDNIDSDWGQSIKTLDPIPSGTPPEQSGNISLLSLGENFNRRKQLAFPYDTDNIYYRRRVDGNFSNWVKLLHTGNYSDYVLPLTGGYMSGHISMNGSDLRLMTLNSSSNDSGDIAFFYGNGQEKCRLWTDNSYTSALGLNYRVFSSDGTQLFSGKIPIGDFLPLSGGTLSSSQIGVLQVNSTHASETGIGILRNSIYKAWFGYNDSIGSYMFSSPAQKYLYITDAGQLLFGGVKVWNENNDGSGSGLDADTLDTYHESSFLRFRGSTETNGENTLWSQLGIKEYYNALPDGLSGVSGVYNYGGCLSIAGTWSRFDIYYPHQGTNSAPSGIWVRTGWDVDRRLWKRLAFTDDTVSNANTVGGCYETDFLRYRGQIPTAYVDISDYNAGATNYQNPLNGTYWVDRTTYGEGFIAFSGAGSASGLDVIYHYARGYRFAIRRRIDANRVSGDWENILTDVNYSTYTDGRYVKKVGDTMSGQLIVETGLNTTDWISDNGQIRAKATGTNYYLGLGASTTGYAIIQGGNSGTGHIPLLLQPSGGNVGIGTTSPSEKLSVNGNASFAGYLSGVTNIDSVLNFNTSLAALGIRNVEASDSESYPLIINGNMWICPTIANKTTLNILGQMTLRSTASTTYRMQFGTYTNTYQPFLNFYDSVGTKRTVLELYTETFTGGRSEHLCIGQGFRYIETDGNGNTTLIGRTYIYGANIHFMVNDRTSSDSGAIVQAMRMFANGRTFVGTPASDTSLSNINASNSHPCFLNAYSALIGKLYLYKPNTDNDTNAVWFEIENGVVKLNGSFYATGAVSALGANGSGGGGSSITLGVVLNHINTHNPSSFAPSVASVLYYESGIWVAKAVTNLATSVTTDCVKITGTQTVSGDKTFSGVTSFTGGVTLVSNITPSVTNQYGLGTSDKRFANVYATNGNFSGTLTAGTLSFTNLSLSGTLSVGSTATAVSFIASGYNSTYVLLSGSIKALSDFVQTSGNQDVAGNKKFTGSTTFSGTATFNADASFTGGLTLASSLKPSQNEQYGLGTSDKRFSSLYVKDANISGSLTVGTVSYTNLSVSGTSSLAGGAKFNKVCIECNSDGSINTSRSSEINCYNGDLYLQHDTNTQGIRMLRGSFVFSQTSGNVSMSSGNNHLTVSTGSGTPYIGKAWVVTSDMRKKVIESYLDVNVDSIALAPMFDFRWKDEVNGALTSGTSAQYWRSVLPNLVLTAPDGYLAIDNASIAIISVIATARKVVDHEHRIQQLEWENERLRKELETLKAA